MAQYSSFTSSAACLPPRFLHNCRISSTRWPVNLLRGPTASDLDKQKMDMVMHDVPVHDAHKTTVLLHILRSCKLSRPPTAMMKDDPEGAFYVTDNANNRWVYAEDEARAIVHTVAIGPATSYGPGPLDKPCQLTFRVCTGGNRDQYAAQSLYRAVRQPAGQDPLIAEDQIDVFLDYDFSIAVTDYADWRLKFNFSIEDDTTDEVPEMRIIPWSPVMNNSSPLSDVAAQVDTIQIQVGTPAGERAVCFAFQFIADSPRDRFYAFPRSRRFVRPYLLDVVGMDGQAPVIDFQTGITSQPFVIQLRRRFAPVSDGRPSGLTATSTVEQIQMRQLRVAKEDQEALRLLSIMPSPRWRAYSLSINAIKGEMSRRKASGDELANSDDCIDWFESSLDCLADM